MNILLINSNPVVSRLLALCTREEEIILEEVKDAEVLLLDHYDVVFIDEGSYEGKVLHLSQNLSIGRKVLLSNEDVEIHDFDVTIPKPFLPSQILEVLHQSEVLINLEEETIDELVTEDTEEGLSIFPAEEGKISGESKAFKLENNDESAQVLDLDEVDKIKSLLEMDEEVETPDDVLSDEEIEQLKVELIKEQLIAEGLEIVGEEEIVEELHTSEDIVVFSNEETTPLKKKLKSNNKKSKKKNKKKKISFSEVDLERIEDAVEVAIATLKRKQMKKLLKGKTVELSIKLEGND